MNRVFIRTWLALLLVAVTLQGCALWTRVETPLATAPDGSFTTTLPVGWVRAEFLKDRLLVTRDGPALQLIEARRVEHGKAFPKTDKASDASMLASELAERTLAEIRTAEDLPGLEVIENAPVTVAGQMGFRLRLKFKNPRGLTYQREVVGFATEAGFFAFVYQAPALLYFDRNRSDFEQLLNAVQLQQKAT